MTSRHINSGLGAAIAPGFELNIAMNTPDISLQKTVPPRSNALGLIAKAVELEQTQGWKARDQGTRSTCNAFAVVAAEELWHAAQQDDDQPMILFSEEYTYSAMRGHDVPVQAEPYIEKIDNDGSTFLKQALDAFEADGLLPYDWMPYRDNPNIEKNEALDIEESHRIAAEVYKIEKTKFFHNINAEKRSINHPGQGWDFAIKGNTIADEIREALYRNVPVVASFAFLEQPWDAVWYGHRARLYGDVLYPSNVLGSALKVAGGHTVCLIGFLNGTATDPDSFVFRNSFGTQAFGGSPHLKPGDLKAPLRGYGLISAENVNRFCWEYLYRNPT